jgi:hypothetical protein
VRRKRYSVNRAVANAAELLESRTLLADATGLALTLPTDAWEGQPNQIGVVHVDAPVAEPLVVTLNSSDATELTAPSTVTIAAGESAASFPLTLPSDSSKDGAQPASLTAGAADGTTSAPASVVVHDADLDRFSVDPIDTPQAAGTPFGVTARALNVSNEPIVGYNDAASLTGLVGTISSVTAFNGSTTVTSTSSSGGITWGYSLRPNQTVTVTHVRSFFGAKVSIWSASNPNLLATQAVGGTPGQWTETPLDRPLLLQANTSYRVGVYADGGTYSFRNTIPALSWGQIFAGLYATGDTAPTAGAGSNIPLVDIRVSSGTVIPVTPSAVTFADGSWGGAVTVGQSASGMRLTLDDGAGHAADSNTFNVTTDAPTGVTLDTFSDTGVITSDGVTRFDNATPAKAMDFRVSGTVAGATVTLYADGTAIGSAVATSTTTTVRSNGAFDLADGAHVVTARQTRADGSLSIDSPPLSLTVDTVAPAQPDAPDLVSTSDSGVSNSDNITNVKTPTFTVGGTTWFRLARNGALLNGAYFSGPYTIPSTSDGTYAFTAEAVDLAGNSSALGPATGVTIDTLVQTPGVPDLRAADDTGASDTDNLTRLRDARLDVGTNEAGTVRTYVDGLERVSLLSGAGTATTNLSGAGGWVVRSASVVGSATTRVDTGDINGDGKLDLVSTGPSTKQVNLGNGDGTFQAPKPFTTPGGWSAALGDFNRDGKADVVTTSRNNEAYIGWSNGDGTFTTGPTLSFGSSGFNEDIVTTGDLNGDGAADIAVSLHNYSCVVVILSNGNGTFATARQYPVYGFAYSPTLADMNNDGRLDIVVSAVDLNAGYRPTVLLNNGSGTFGSPITSAALLDYPDGYGVGDFNKDGKADVMVVGDAGAARLYTGRGDGRFNAGATTFSLGGDIDAGGAGDVDGDGNLDFLAAASFSSAGVNVLFGNGDGTFKPREVVVPSGGKDIRTADFDADGRTDFVVATYATTGLPVIQYRSGVVEDGLHFAYATFEDLAGNKSPTSPTLAVRVDTKPPTLSLATTAVANATVGFSAGGSFTDAADPGNAWTATVDFGDGAGAKPLTLNTDKTFALGNTFATPGTYTVVVTITDNQGNATARNMTVTVGPGPQGIEPAAGGSYTLSGNSLVVQAGVVALTQELAGVDVTVQAGATAVIRANQHWHSLSVAAGGRAAVEAGATILVIDQLQVAGGATFDLRRAALITQRSVADVEALIASGHDGGTWQGDGIVTSDPDATAGLTSLGIGSADAILGLAAGQTDLWRGETVAAGSTLVLYTYGGDANLDGVVSGDDYSAIDFSIQVPGATGWANGDFNHDGFVSGDDYSAIDFNIVAQALPL